MAISGWDPATCITLSTVSCYDIDKDKWLDQIPPLNKARMYASACVLNATAYVFCGKGSGKRSLNSIEVISETSLFSQSTDRWLLIAVHQNILA